jgi:REP element-mobilizing transposase RayT
MVFSTLGRRNLIAPEVRARIHAYLGGIIANLNGLAVRIGGTGDHVHIVCCLRADTSPSEAVMKIKANSSRWVHETMPSMSDFAWQEGYGAFTVSRSALDAVVSYVAGQEAHHRKMTFQEELLTLLKKHGIEYDERFIWG